MNPQKFMADLLGWVSFFTLIIFILALATAWGTAVRNSQQGESYVNVPTNNNAH